VRIEKVIKKSLSRQLTTALRVTIVTVMAFVKLDTGILDSTLWIDRDLREVFITALLMAQPVDFNESQQQIKVDSMERTEFYAPPGWYGFIRAAGIGIINRAGVNKESGMEALRKLGEPELDSRSLDFDGRRLIRVDGGYLALTFMKHRDRDHTAADRQKRLRERKKALEVINEVNSNAVTSRDSDVTSHRQIAEGRGQTTDTNEKQQQVPFIESNLFGEEKGPVTKPNGKAKIVPVGNPIDQASWPGNGRPYPPCKDPNDPEPLNPFYNRDRNGDFIPEIWQAYEDWLDRQCPFGDGVPLSA
jgi:hypothetical protein